MPPTPLVAIADHQIPARAPLRIEPGDRVQAGDRDTTWPAFVFVRADGGEGWVPFRHLDAERPTATVVTAYDTTELPVITGEPLAGLVDDAESGWWWCENAAGRRGWVPHSAVGTPR